MMAKFTNTISEACRMVANFSNAAFRHYFVIFTVALSTIAYQIVLTRLLSVTFYYHFAFVGITLAMLGLTYGAIRVFTQGDAWAGKEGDQQIARHAVSCALAMALATALHLCYPLNSWTRSLSLYLSLVVALLAFTCSGVCITLLLTHFPASTSRLYACDLAGAALGAVFVIPGLNALDPVGMVLLLSTLVAIAGLQIRPERVPTKQHIISAGVGILVAGTLGIQLSSWLSDGSIFTFDVKKGASGAPPDFERWNTFSRVAVSSVYQGPPFGWGFGSDHSDVNVLQRRLTIDADAMTVLTHWRGSIAELSYLKDDVVNLGYHVRHASDVAIIGVGGGRDVLSAIAFEAKRIEGIELNPAIIEALTTRFAEFTGYLNQLPQVHLAVAEARAFINQSAYPYDLIQISLTDTWAATAAGGLALSENRLYTVEAWQEFLTKLNDQGMLTVSRWFVPGTHEGEFYRLLALAAEALKRHRVSFQALRRHMLAANVGGIVTLAVSKTPFDEAEVARFKETARIHHYAVLLSPTEVYDEVAEEISSGRATSEFFSSLPMDVTPSTDNRPFFFHMARLFDGPAVLLHGNVSRSMNSKNDFASLVLGILLMGTLGCTVFLVILPLQKYVPLGTASAALPNLLYFGCIGLGFMLIELSQMQRLMIFLGHPVYGLSVVLFTLLLSAGLGSYTVSGTPAPQRPFIRPAALCILLVAMALATGIVTEYAKYQDTALRIAISVALLVPSGMAMGIMFPLGIALSKSRFAGLLPWFWGINGAMSVLASVGGMVLSMQYGISGTYWVGVACYAGCVPLVHLLARDRVG